MLRKWECLPKRMRNQAVRKYYNILQTKKKYLVLKRSFDLIVSIILLIALLPIFILVSIAIKFDSKGPIMFRQIRVTQYGKLFRIYKFRTMVTNADKNGTQITTKNDARITKVGRVLRKLRLDEIPQLFNIITGDMTFIGTRPEVIKYVEKYTDEMWATLLLPAGVTSETSIRFKDEEKLLENADDVDNIYINEVLPEKMKCNLTSMEKLSFFYEIRTMFRTVREVLKKEKNAVGSEVRIR
ncbi:MAG: sugar transferase [Clostridiaceae bacterium]|jgi:lipopolysaccharide/colanic/teichoic acid biosynthesis glycosyltransferase|nr:sugar transferase [Clostridiaceae bacterium]